MRWQHFFCLVFLTATASAATRTSSQVHPVTDPYFNQATAFINAAKLTEFRADLDQAVPAAIANLKHPDLDALIRLAAYRQFAWYFGRLDGLSGDDKTLLKWLITQPRLFPTLMLALSDADPPDQLLNVLRRLKAVPNVSLDEWAELATAICVDWDKEVDSDNPDRKPDLDRATRLFEYYVLAERQGMLKNDPRVMPWELGIYGVDARVSDVEIVWALRRYGQSGSAAAAYLDLPPASGAAYYRDDPIPDAHPYTLDNLRQFGGSDEDRAWFGVQVSRALGVPAVLVRGVAREDNTGRPAMAIFAGDGWTMIPRPMERATMTNPQTRENIGYQRLELLTEVSRTQREQALASMALVKLAEPTPPPVTPDAPPATPPPPSLTLPDDDRLAMNLLAAELATANDRAWSALTDLGASGRLTDQQMQSISTLIGRLLMPNHADYALDLYLQLAQGRDVPTQLAVLDQCARVFAPRGDLVAQIRITQGDLLAKQQATAEALRAYGQVLRQPMASGTWVVDAMDRVDGILREAGRQTELVGAYRFVLSRMPQPSPNANIEESPYYEICDRFMRVLEAVGDLQDEQQIRQQMQNLTDAAAGVR